VSGPIRGAHLDEVNERLKDWPVYRRSHRGEIANFVGCMGEVIVERWLRRRGFDCKTVGEISHDMEMHDNGELIMFDVKTKDRTVAPRPDYEATVPRYVYEKQNPHAYVFVSLKRDRDKGPRAFTEAHIVGAISRDEFNCRKYEVSKGPKSNGAVFFTDAYNVRIADLCEPQEFPRSVTI